MTVWNLTDTQCQNCTSHRLPILIFVQLSLRIQFEVNQFGGAQSDHNLPFVRSGRDDCFPLGNSPLVDFAVGRDMPDTMRVDLEKSVGANLLYSNSRSRGQESSVLHLFNRFSDGKNEGAVHER